MHAMTLLCVEYSQYDIQRIDTFLEESAHILHNS